MKYISKISKISYCLVGFKKEEVRRGYGEDN